MKVRHFVRSGLAAIAAMTICSGMERMGTMTPQSQSVRGSTASPSGSVSFGAQCGAEAGIADFAAAQAIFRPTPAFPKEDTGAESIAASAARTLATWRFTPATRRGAAADQFGNIVNVAFRFEGSDASRGSSSHDTVVRRYNEGRDLLERKEYDKAIRTLEFAFGLRLNLHEQSMLSFSLALAYAAKQDGPQSLFHLRHATIDRGDFLDKTSAGPALEMQVAAEAAYGNFTGALCAYDQLKSVAPASAAEGTRPASIAAQIDRALKDPAPLAVAGELAAVFGDARQAAWRHPLLRRKFSFANITGELKDYHLVCRTTVLDAPVDAETLWTVPPEAGACTLSVRGAPGAKFKLIEEQ